MTSSRLQHFLEIYHRTTASGRRVAWDEPTETDSPEIRRHNAFLAKQLQKKRDAKERLKTKGAVPTRNGQPIFENDKVTENMQQVLMSFRRAYQSNRPMRFREWIRMVAEMLDDLSESWKTAV
jgi:hypothetical protein